MASIFDKLNLTNTNQQEQQSAPVVQAVDTAALGTDSIAQPVASTEAVVSPPSQSTFATLATPTAPPAAPMSQADIMSQPIPSDSPRLTVPAGIFPPPPPLDASPEEVTRHCLDKCRIAVNHIKFGRDTLAETWVRIKQHPEHKELLMPEDVGAIHAILVALTGRKFNETQEKNTARSARAAAKQEAIASFAGAFGDL